MTDTREQGPGQDDVDALAGEYVLGTLSGAERDAVAERRRHDPALDAAIEAWELRFSPLLATVAPVTPPDAIGRSLQRWVEEQGDSFAPPRPVPSAEIVALRRRLRRWQAVAAGASALAACLMIFVASRDVRERLAPSPTPRTGANYVAVLQKDAQSPAFLMTVDIDALAFTVVPLAATTPAGKSYELWLVSDALGTPKSLGLVESGGLQERPRLAGIDPALIRNATYAVSVEPPGGSRTGAPTGPVVFAGKLVAVRP